MLAAQWDPKALCTEISPFCPLVRTHTKLLPFLRQYLVVCSHTAPLHWNFKHKKISFPPESPAEPPAELLTAPSSPVSLPLLSPSPTNHSHLQPCSSSPFLVSSLLLRFPCMDGGLGCLPLLVCPCISPTCCTPTTPSPPAAPALAPATLNPSELSHVTHPVTTNMARV